MITNPKDNIVIDRLAEGGSYGVNGDSAVSNNTNSGIHFLNLNYSQILVANNEVRMPETFHDIAIPITIKDTFSKIETKTPVKITFQIITPNEEINSEYNFPFEIMVRYTDYMRMEQKIHKLFL
ncbi:hypothetical protein [Nitrosopumilus sp.]|uniref:hypothetical protein n=1 Tax=Nitrosopumilus sp. TaxID=2024843 RepID=UPI003B5B13C9